MKILHTADWHIGKMLYKYDLSQDHILFFEWLNQHIINEKIDVLLVSGDIFDLANPSAKDLKIYYDVLKNLVKSNTKVIITGGNHDGVNLLNAPKEILDVLDVQIVGGVPENVFEQIIPIYNPEKKPECIVLAVPFLRDKDLRQSIEAGTSLNKSDVIKKAIANHYDLLTTEATSRYGKHIPIIAMGHLFMYGSITSDSEREIHIGNLEGITTDALNDTIQYFALGHIHKAQRVGGKDNIRYSGSPIYLDFSERQTDKIVIQLNVNNGKLLEPETVAIPKFRELIRFSGNLDSIQEQLKSYHPNYPLISLVELNILEESFSPSIIQKSENMVSENSSPFYKIIKCRISFEKADQKNQLSHYINEQIESLRPIDIFNRKLDADEMDEANRALLLEAHYLITEELNL